MATLEQQDMTKVCLVCGDKASSINFNVMTCESCKAFFRRNALKNKNFKCPSMDNCETTVLTRRTCKKCRLTKCFEVGMSKSLIMSEAQRQEKRRLVERNRAKRRSIIHKTLNTVSDETAEQKINSEIITIVDATSSQADLSYPEVSESANTMCRTTAPEGPVLDKEDLITIPKQILLALINTCHQNTPCHHDGDKEQHKPLACRCACRCGAQVNILPTIKDCADISVCTDNCSQYSNTYKDANRFCLKRVTRVPNFNYGLDPSKMNRLEELKIAFQIMYDIPDYGFHDQRNGKATSRMYHNGHVPLLPMTVFLATTDDVVRRSVKFWRSISLLNTFSKADQKSLVNTNIGELIILRGLHAYIPELNAWRHTHPMRPLISMEMMKCFNGYHLIYNKFFPNFPRHCIEDEHIFLTLVALVIFNPTGEGVEDRVSVRLIQDFYCNALHQYLCTNRGDKVADHITADLKERVSAIHDIANRATPKVYAEFTSEMEPLLVELRER